MPELGGARRVTQADRATRVRVVRTDAASVKVSSSTLEVEKGDAVSEDALENDPMQSMSSRGDRSDR